MCVIEIKKCPWKYSLKEFRIKFRQLLYLFFGGDLLDCSRLCVCGLT